MMKLMITKDTSSSYKLMRKLKLFEGVTEEIIITLRSISYMNRRQGDQESSQKCSSSQ